MFRYTSTQKTPSNFSNSGNHTQALTQNSHSKLKDTIEAKETIQQKIAYTISKFEAILIRKSEIDKKLNNIVKEIGLSRIDIAIHKQNQQSIRIEFDKATKELIKSNIETFHKYSKEGPPEGPLLIDHHCLGLSMKHDPEHIRLHDQTKNMSRDVCEKIANIRKNKNIVEELKKEEQSIQKDLNNAMTDFGKCIFELKIRKLDNPNDKEYDHLLGIATQKNAEQCLLAATNRLIDAQSALITSKNLLDYSEKNIHDFSVLHRVMKYVNMNPSIDNDEMKRLNPYAEVFKHIELEVNKAEIDLQRAQNGLLQANATLAKTKQAFDEYLLEAALPAAIDDAAPPALACDSHVSDQSQACEQVIATGVEDPLALV